MPERKQWLQNSIILKNELFKDLIQFVYEQKTKQNKTKQKQKHKQKQEQTNKQTNKIVQGWEQYWPSMAKGPY